MRTAIVLAFLALFSACASAPPGPPEEVASSVLKDLRDGREGDAKRTFDRVADDAEYRERMYPVLYEGARAHYEADDASGAAEVLRFLKPRYPEAIAVRQALLYSLFLERAGSTELDPELTKEIDALCLELRAEDHAPEWTYLVEAQQAVDRGDADEGRRALADFLVDWDGQPQELLVYVEDLERWLRTEGGTR